MRRAAPSKSRRHEHCVCATPGGRNNVELTRTDLANGELATCGAKDSVERMNQRKPTQADEGLQGGRESGRIVERSPIRNGNRCEHQPRTQRFCRTMHRFGVAYGFPVGNNYIDSQAW